MTPRKLTHSDTTPESLYINRREFIRNAVLFTGVAAGIGGGLVWLTGGASGKRKAVVGAAPTPDSLRAPADFTATRRANFAGDEAASSFEQVTTYNNFYEFGLDKADPAANAHTLRTRPWTVAVEGSVRTPRRLDIDEVLRWFPLEERVYRMRCVEAWSLVIPWLGFPLAEFIKRLDPLPSAKYVAFTTLHDAEQMPGQRTRSLDWPYVEGLRMDEAMHPLAFMAVGLYGQPLPNQNGAPLRLVVPWKYGFKGCKSIVSIRFSEERPATTWNRAAPHEYGFYANVNPEVDHPRWSQATERRLGEFSRRPTLPFNGYAAEVAHLYSGMDLRENF
ncbi:MAG: protein-methionine-sulfoxide reductase catalytic subunit MsrP [bacterium]